MKGKIRIDLHNHNSGFTERIEQENLVTNAINKILPNLFYWGGVSGTLYQPLATTLLGGLMLFDGALTESVDNIFFPSDVHLLGFAGQFNNTSNAFSGSLNSIESGPTATGYTTVWDFSTSQCNGTIASLSRTLSAGYVDEAYRLFSPQEGYIKSFWSNNFIPLCYSDGYYYGLLGNTVNKIKTPSPPYKVGEVAYNGNVGSFETIKTLTFPSLYRYINNFYFTPNLDGYAYLIQAQGNSSGNGQAKYFSIKLSDLSFDVSEVTTLTLPSCQIKDGYFKMEMINGGKAYLPSYDMKSIYVQDLSNPNNIVKSDLPEGFVFIASSSGSHYCLPKRTGACVYIVENGSNEYYAIVYPDGTIKKSLSVRNASTDQWPTVAFRDDLINRFPVAGNANNHMAISPDYLGTICNLASPVTKTASQSMKITYTLTDAQEE